MSHRLDNLNFPSPLTTACSPQRVESLSIFFREVSMRWSLLVWFILCALLLPDEAAAQVSSLVAQIKAVGKEGRGHVEAARAWQELVKQGVKVLPEALGGLDDANPMAANWLRGAVETIAEEALATGQPLPAAQLEAFVRDTRHTGIARRLAYDYLVRVDPSIPDRLLPGMLNDPGHELRRDAVAVVLKQAQENFDKDNKPAATAAFKKALEFARDRDQVELVAERLKKLGVEIDLTSHFGFVTRWMVAGSFNNVKGVGFHTVYPPEKGVDLQTSYVGKDNQKVAWREHVTTEALGLVDFNKIIAHLHGVTAFAYAEVISPSERPIEVRATSNNAIRIFLNGKEVFAREEYHHGTRLDQHVGKAILKAGRNELLVKVCQNEQKESWAQQWSFQLRLCDYLGAAVPVTVAIPRAVGGKD